MKLLQYLVISGFLLLGLKLNAQKISTNENGETIILFSDGSWRYYDENDEYDQFLMKKHLQTLQPKEGSDAHDSTHFKMDESLNKGEVLSKKVADAKIKLEDVQDEKQILQDQIRRYKKLKNKEKVTLLKKLLKNKKIEIKETKKFYKNAEKQLAYYQKESNKIKDEDDFEIDNQGDDKDKDSDAKNDKNESAAYAKYSAQNDVMVTPPTFPCTFIEAENGEEKLKQQLEPQLFFNYTPTAMMAAKLNKEENYIQCIGQISKVKGGNLILDLTITIASENAKNEYGLIEKGSLLILKLIDHSSISISSRRTVIGRFNEVDKSVVYEASYNIPAGSVKKLASKELDFIKLIWSTGYEEYEIYETDFFIRQLKCLK